MVMTFDHNALFLAYCDGWAEGRGDRTWYKDSEHFESVVRVEFEDWYRNNFGAPRSGDRGDAPA